MEAEGAGKPAAGSARNALVGVLVVALVSAGCVALTSRRRASIPMATDLGVWTMRRPRAIGDHGPGNTSKLMRKIGRAVDVFGHGHGLGHGHAALSANESRCYSLNKPDVCEGIPNGNCTDPDEDHKDARSSSHFCGTRVERKNPCWLHNGREKCLPYFFILGEMKCGTTTVYKKLLEHPQVVAPRNKEVRYLMQPKYRKRTATWYASNFDSVVTAPKDAVTFDASPTSFNAQAVAPGWTAKWLPNAKLIVMLRDPVQRTYSHFRMGVNWLKVSKHCFIEKDGQRAPLPIIRGLLPNVTSFAWQARLGVTDVALRECKHQGLGWASKTKLSPLTAPMKKCLLSSPVSSTVLASFREWEQARATRKNEEQEQVYLGERAVNHCSEMMLRPGAGVLRSYRYAENLAIWLRWFPMSSLKVVATEDLERSFEDTFADIVNFLELRAFSAATLSKHLHLCVTSKAGIMDEKRSELERAGVIGGGKVGSEGVDDCDSQTDKVKGADGILRYTIESQTRELLHTFFKSSNQKLYKLLGRDFGW